MGLSWPAGFCEMRSFPLKPFNGFAFGSLKKNSSCFSSFWSPPPRSSSPSPNLFWRFASLGTLVLAIIDKHRCTLPQQHLFHHRRQTNLRKARKTSLESHQPYLEIIERKVAKEKRLCTAESLECTMRFQERKVQDWQPVQGLAE